MRKRRVITWCAFLSQKFSSFSSSISTKCSSCRLSIQDHSQSQPMWRPFTPIHSLLCLIRLAYSLRQVNLSQRLLHSQSPSIIHRLRRITRSTCHPSSLTSMFWTTRTLRCSTFPTMPAWSPPRSKRHPSRRANSQVSSLSTYCKRPSQARLQRLKCTNWLQYHSSQLLRPSHWIAIQLQPIRMSSKRRPPLVRIWLLRTKASQSSTST